jgi:hypothetical protein
VAGINGAGKGKKPRGTGFIYEDRPEIEPTPAQIETRERARERSKRRAEQRRIVRMERRESREWKNRIYEFRRAVRESKSDLALALEFSKKFVCRAAARDYGAHNIRGLRRANDPEVRYRVRESRAEAVMGLAAGLFNSLPTPNASERIYYGCFTNEAAYFHIEPPALDSERDERLLIGGAIIGGSFRELLSDEFRQELLDMSVAFAVTLWCVSERAPEWAFQFPDSEPALKVGTVIKRQLVRMLGMVDENVLGEWIPAAIRALVEHAESKTEEPESKSW